MNIQNVIIPVSGIIEAGSMTASLVILLAKSGLSYIPVACTNQGILLTSGIN